jgi:hypothetical protein
VVVLILLFDIPAFAGEFSPVTGVLSTNGAIIENENDSEADPFLLTGNDKKVI